MKEEKIKEICKELLELYLHRVNREMEDWGPAACTPKEFLKIEKALIELWNDIVKK